MEGKKGEEDRAEGIKMFFCRRCGIAINSNADGYCTDSDRKGIEDGVVACAVAMTPDAEGKKACWCTSFPSRQFKHPKNRRLSKKEMDAVVRHCMCCEGTGRCNEEEG